MTAMTQDWPCVSFIFPPSLNYIRLNRHVTTCSAIKPLYSTTVGIIFSNRSILNLVNIFYVVTTKLSPPESNILITLNKQSLEAIIYLFCHLSRRSSLPLSIYKFRFLLKNNIYFACKISFHFFSLMINDRILQKHFTTIFYRLENP